MEEEALYSNSGAAKHAQFGRPGRGHDDRLVKAWAQAFANSSTLLAASLTSVTRVGRGGGTVARANLIADATMGASPLRQLALR